MLGDNVVAFPFGIFRGDSFQGVLQNPSKALKAALIIQGVVTQKF